MSESPQRPGLPLDGKTAVVAGAASPIGEACVRRFATEGADVLAVDRAEADVMRLRAEVVPGGRAVSVCVADSSTVAGIGTVVAEAGARWAQLDVLVNCSGLVDHWTFDSESMEQWDAVFRVNLFAPVFLARALRPLLFRSARSSVVFLGTIDGERGNPSLPAYSASKGGLVPMTHVLADDWGPHGVRVNCLATGLIDHSGPADPRRQTPPARIDSLIELTPLRRAPRPEDVAAALLFLASDDSSYMTGSVLTLDGGRVAVTPGTSRSHEGSNVPL